LATVPHLASHILNRIAHQLSQDWEGLYQHPIYFLETFVAPERFRGTGYRAATWVVLGRTTGRVRTITPTARTVRSKKYWVIRSPHDFASYYTEEPNEIPRPEGAPPLEMSIEELDVLVEQVRPALSEGGYQSCSGPCIRCAT
jgi:hypothetical protein